MSGRRYPERTRSDFYIAVGVYGVVALLVRALAGYLPEYLVEFMRRGGIAVMFSGMFVAYYLGSRRDPWTIGKIGVYALAAAIILYPLGKELMASGNALRAAGLAGPMVVTAAMTYVGLKIKDYVVRRRAR